MSDTYSGYKNQQTFNTVVHLINDEDCYKAYNAHIAKNGLFTPQTAKKFVKNLWGDRAPDGGGLSKVKWAEVAEAMNPEQRIEAAILGFKVLMIPHIDYSLNHKGTETIEYLITTPVFKATFTGSRFRLSPNLQWDSPKAVMEMLYLITLRPGDAYSDHFKSYSKRQMVWATSNTCAKLAPLFEIERFVENPEPEIKEDKIEVWTLVDRLDSNHVIEMTIKKGI